MSYPLMYVDSNTNTIQMGFGVLGRFSYLFMSNCIDKSGQLLFTIAE